MPTIIQFYAFILKMCRVLCIKQQMLQHLCCYGFPYKLFPTFSTIAFLCHILCLAFSTPAILCRIFRVPHFPSLHFGLCHIFSHPSSRSKVKITDYCCTLCGSLELTIREQNDRESLNLIYRLYI